jgi:hypothetical protein
MADVLENATLDLKSKISEQVDALREQEIWQEITRIHSALNALEEIRKVPKTDLGTLLGIMCDDQPKIGKHEFAGLPALEAAKRFLRKIAPRQTAASLDEIIAALKSGSLDADRDELRISLSRSTTEIYKAGEDIYGLVESFPHIKRGTPGRKKGATATNGITALQSAGTGPSSDEDVAELGKMEHQP